jgi:2-polyprenyl-6-methoxyphenol hydroxylase-like FAD-dependent oxidoreductase
MGSSQRPTDQLRHAVVAGASMAGLLAARVLADHFDRVTLVERDRLPSRPEARKGVPQGRHVHVLLARGLQVLEGLFPSISDELRTAGALAVNSGREIAWHHAGGWRTNYDSDIWLLAMTRPLLETRVAERVRALPNVAIRENERVVGVSSNQGAVTGVEVRGTRQRNTVEADLVVDATGRGSAMPTWLEQLGFAAPATDEIPVPLTYSTCQFRRGNRAPDWRALLFTAPGARRTGFAWAIEDHRWLVTLAGLFDEPAPRDHEAFLAFARSLPASDLHDEICELEALSDPLRYRFPGSRWRRYDRLETFPAGLIATGDAVCSFNPVFGQGMTVAALEAETLARAVSQAGSGGKLDPQFPHQWYRQIGRVIDVAWQAVSIEDLRFPELADRTPASLRPLQWYMDRVHRATHGSTAATEQFYRVIGFLDPPTALFRPRVIAGALLAARR